MKAYIFIFYHTVGVLLLVACATSKPQGNKNRAASATPICIANLKAEIRQHWHRKNRLHPRSGLLISSIVLKDDAFCEKVVQHYAPCLVGHKNATDIVTLFGKHSGSREHSTGTYLMYQVVDTLQEENNTCLLFRFSHSSKQLDTVLYTRCEYPLMRID